MPRFLVIRRDVQELDLPPEGVAVLLQQKGLPPDEVMLACGYKERASGTKGANRCPNGQKNTARTPE